MSVSYTVDVYQGSKKENEKFQTVSIPAKRGIWQNIYEEENLLKEKKH